MLTRPEHDALLNEALRDPAAEARLYRELGQAAAVLVTAFIGSRRRAHADGPVYASALARAATSALLQPTPGEPEPLAVRPLRDGLLVAYASAVHALNAAMNGQLALDQLNRERRGRPGDGTRSDPVLVGFGLGFGDALITPEPDVLGAEADAAFHLAGAAEAGEILASDAFMSALGPPPPGVGSHRGRADRAHAIGMTFTVLRDYRS